MFIFGQMAATLLMYIIIRRFSALQPEGKFWYNANIKW